jgi:hypothetical protein
MLRNSTQKSRYLGHKNAKLIPILSQLNPFNTHIFCFCEIHCKTVGFEASHSSGQGECYRLVKVSRRFGGVLASSFRVEAYTKQNQQEDSSIMLVFTVPSNRST